jgi:hypothetical protein
MANDTWTLAITTAINEGADALNNLADETEDWGMTCLNMSASVDDGNFGTLSMALRGLADMSRDLETHCASCGSELSYGGECDSCRTWEERMSPLYRGFSSSNPIAQDRELREWKRR